MTISIVSKDFKGVPKEIAEEVGYTDRDRLPGNANNMYVACPNNTQEKIEDELHQLKLKTFDVCGTPLLNATRSQTILQLEDYPQHLIPIYSAASSMVHRLEVTEVIHHENTRDMEVDAWYQHKKATPEEKLDYLVNIGGLSRCNIFNENRNHQNPRASHILFGLGSR